MKVAPQFIEIGALFSSAFFGVFLRLFYRVSDGEMIIILRPQYNADYIFDSLYLTFFLSVIIQ